MDPNETLECPRCKGSGYIRLANGMLEFCTCFFKRQLATQLGSLTTFPEISSPSKLSPFLLNRRGTGLIEVDSLDGSMEAFSVHLRKALTDEFYDAISKGRRPITWRETTMVEVTDIRFGNMPYAEKFALLTAPQLLIIRAAMWPPYVQHYDNVRMLIGDRMGKKNLTWLVNPNFAKMKDDKAIPLSFKDFIKDILGLDRFVHITREESKGESGAKVKKTTEMDVHQGIGITGINQKMLTDANDPVQTRIAKMEKTVDQYDRNSSDG